MLPLTHHPSLITKPGSNVIVPESIEQHTILHPTYGDQIIQRLEQAVPHAVFRDAVDAGIMTHRHFRDRETMHERERRKESMQALKEPDAFQHGASKDLQRAPRIMDTVMRKKFRTGFAIREEIIFTKPSCRCCLHPQTRSWEAV